MKAMYLSYYSVEMTFKKTLIVCMGSREVDYVAGVFKKDALIL